MFLGFIFIVIIGFLFFFSGFLPLIWIIGFLTLFSSHFFIFIVVRFLLHFIWVIFLSTLTVCLYLIAICVCCGSTCLIISRAFFLLSWFLVVICLLSLLIYLFGFFPWLLNLLCFVIVFIRRKISPIH